MKLPWNKDADKPADSETDELVTSADEDSTEVEQTPAKGSAYTPGKGRPTPKRSEAQARRRGPMAPPPTNRAEARARKKQLKSTMTREEKRALSDERRSKRAEQREAMMEGDERYLMPRDKGPVRRFARDVVDSRRNFAGLFMPFAIVLIFLMFMPFTQQYPGITNLLLLVFVLFVAIDSVILGRIVNNRVRERFPDSTDGGFRLGWYAFARAMQLRKMRAPRPVVSPGDKV